MKILTVPQSGSLAGQTASRNRFGQYLRTRATPVQPRTTAQMAVRSALTGLTQGWSSLSESERAAWVAWALVHPRTDSLGQSVNITGAQAYIGVNLGLSRASLATVAVPPSDSPTTPLTGIVVTATLLALGGLDVLSAAWTPTPLAADEYIVVDMAPWTSAGVSFVGSWYFIDKGLAASVSPLDVTSSAVTRFGVPLEGQRAWLRARVLRADGAMSVPVTGTALVTAP